MGRKNNPNIHIEKIKLDIKNIKGSFPGQIITRGNSFYIRLDAEFIRFWELEAGDEILVTVTNVKRLKAKK